MSEELPPDLHRLRAVETYLRLQLRTVQARIAELRDEHSTQDAEPAARWTLQLLPSPVGASPRGYLHRAERCFIRGGRALSRKEARNVLTMPDVEACGACHAEDGLR
ncbi:DUF6233 domain-containing protein [Streptomyces rugosispiralis]|uniref:DUF6233 domain-containing protein n=1 Tax=Streptomyces rugosispiralis TaxID=2967341 RepID=A0ABT1VB65_9ACTN|nr:DUF6233 domain-containing protein [Streptomyces rugosispiralis]MCQ8194651.1 DUF6233 domain-containing protein [Streptomyces rugosispiralis]